jgi:hypothetical protein
MVAEAAPGLKAGVGARGGLRRWRGCMVQGQMCKGLSASDKFCQFLEAAYRLGVLLKREGKVVVV